MCSFFRGFMSLCLSYVVHWLMVFKPVLLVLPVTESIACKAACCQRHCQSHYGRLKIHSPVQHTGCDPQQTGFTDLWQAKGRTYAHSSEGWCVRVCVCRVSTVTVCGGLVCTTWRWLTFGICLGQAIWSIYNCYFYCYFHFQSLKNSVCEISPTH